MQLVWNGEGTLKIYVGRKKIFVKPGEAIPAKALNKKQQAAFKKDGLIKDLDATVKAKQPAGLASDEAKAKAKAAAADAAAAEAAEGDDAVTDASDDETANVNG